MKVQVLSKIPKLLVVQLCFPDFLPHVGSTPKQDEAAAGYRRLAECGDYSGMCSCFSSSA
jgi:hypothetical protein